MTRKARGSADNREITMMGLDPGLGSTGYAVASIDLTTRQISKVISVGLVETDRQKLKQVRQTSDNLRRARHQVDTLKAIIDEHGVSMIAMEMCAAAQHIYPTFSSGVMIGVAASLGREIIEVLPHEVKVAATGDKGATKARIVAWAVGLTGKRKVGWPTSSRANSFGVRLRDAYVSKSAEHPADALGAIQASLNTEQFKIAARLLQ